RQPARFAIKVGEIGSEIELYGEQSVIHAHVVKANDITDGTACSSSVIHGESNVIRPIYRRGTVFQATLISERGAHRGLSQHHASRQNTNQTRQCNSSAHVLSF